MRPRIFITQPVAPSAIARLRAIADVDLNPDPLHIPGKDELVAAVRGHDILFCLLHDNIDGDIVRANPRLRAIASMSITPSNIDVAAATALGIPVTATPRALLDDSTVDIAFTLLLAVGRRPIEADRHVRAGNVLGCQSSYLEARGVSGRTLGILMDSHGGREELAPYPDWAARYLVHKNATQKAYVLAHGDLSGSWPIHVREAENCQWTNPYLP